MSFDSFIAQCVSDSINAAPAPEPPPKPLTLVERVTAYMAELMNSEGEYTPKLAELDGAIDEKALGYKEYELRLKSEEAGLRAKAQPFLDEGNALIKKADTIKAQRASLKARLLEAMILTDKTEIQTARGRIYVQSLPSTRITNEEEWLKTALAEHEQYVNTTHAPKKELLLHTYKEAYKKNYKALLALNVAGGLGEDAAVREAARQARAGALLALPPGTEIVETKFLKGL